MALELTLVEKVVWGTSFIAYGLTEIIWQIRFGVLNKEKTNKLLKFLEFYFETIRPFGQRGFLIGGFFIFIGLGCYFM